MSDKDVTWELKLPFDTDDPEFVRGFEAGRLYALLGSGAAEFLLDADLPLHFTAHATNAEMVLRIAELHGLRARSQDLDDEWIHLTLERA